ncbi:MAG TPA: hypothetical protein VMB26_09285 [Candidatus Binataceae bacterium]|nr:hypothetical protein [Candidatus Binataceae bacterium]
MDCFEVRHQFAEFWRGTVEEERRQKLLGHLKGCAGCDHAFRVFALTAPVLHSESRPAVTSSNNEASRLPAPTAPAPRLWWAATAVATLAMAATVAVYLAVVSPTETLDEALSPQDAVGEVAPPAPASPFDLSMAG